MKIVRLSHAVILSGSGCLITPFNVPLNLVCHKVGPAIAAGNSVILKPAEQTPVLLIARPAL